MKRIQALRRPNYSDGLSETKTRCTRLGQERLPVDERTNNTHTALELCQLLECLLAREALSQEGDYRIRRLIRRTRSLRDKMFLKTVKGRELVLLCIELTRALDDHVRSSRQGFYRQLTALEDAFHDLLRKTVEFRVKAG
ncbi:MAG: hypothetical protein AB1646_10235 [Thermodesulfobacteriota bacterium]